MCVNAFCLKNDQQNVLTKPGLLVTTDYFDCISKDFMINAFQKFGFVVDFVKWVCVLMKDTKSCVSYCRWLSGFFAVESGIQHGCLFSWLAFVLAVEIRDCKDITVIKN